MLTVGVLGTGNAGCQIANGIKESRNILALALNSSDNDIATIGNIDSITIGDNKGSGKNRKVAKKFMEERAGELVNNAELKTMVGLCDVVFIVSATGGGTGSGQGPILNRILQRKFAPKDGEQKTLFINIGILPTLKESMAAQENTLDYLRELTSFDSTYMLYDNGKRASNGMSTVKTFDEINAEIMDDIEVLSGKYQYATSYDDIDDKDMLGMLDTPGRIMVTKAVGFTDKDLDDSSIESRLIDYLRSSGHAEMDRDRIIKRFGIVMNLKRNMMEEFDKSVPALKELVGEPVEGFEHTYVTQADEPNRVYGILTGMSIPDDRLIKIDQRIKEGLERTQMTKKSSVLHSADTSSVKDMRSTSSDSEAPKDPDDFTDLFSEFS